MGQNFWSNPHVLDSDEGKLKSSLMFSTMQIVHAAAVAGNYKLATCVNARWNEVKYF